MVLQKKLTSYYPEKKFKDAQFTTFGRKYFKEYQIWVKHIEVKSDQGWLLEDEITMRTYGFDFVKELVDFRDLGDTFLEVQFRASPFYTYYERSYIKLQDIFGNLEGLVSVFLIEIAVAVLPYVKLKFYEDLVNEVFDVHGYHPDETFKAEKREEKKEPGKLEVYQCENNKDKNDVSIGEIRIPLTQPHNESIFIDVEEQPPVERIRTDLFEKDKQKNSKPAFSLDLKQVGGSELLSFNSNKKGSEITRPEDQISFTSKTAKNNTLLNKKNKDSTIIPKSYSNNLLVEAPSIDKLQSKNMPDHTAPRLWYCSF